VGDRRRACCFFISQVTGPVFSVTQGTFVFKWEVLGSGQGEGTAHTKLEACRDGDGAGG
jgi:hypothetical protein